MDDNAMQIPDDTIRADAGLAACRDMADALRALSFDIAESAGVAAPAAALTLAGAAAVLFGRYIKFDPNDSRWPDRDRLVVSAGQGEALLSVLLHLSGYDDVPIEALRRGPRAVEYGRTRGVETAGGPLGQGLAHAVGMALAERMLAARYGADAVDHRTYVLADAACLADASNNEALALAGKLQLSRLVVLYAALGNDGATLARVAAAGWSVAVVDGNDLAAINAALQAAQISTGPTLIACSSGAAVRPNGGSPFIVAEPARAAWRVGALHGARLRSEWERRVAALDYDVKHLFLREVRGEFESAVNAALDAGKRGEPVSMQSSWDATRQVLAALAAAVPALTGAGAEFGKTLRVDTAEVAAGAYRGRHVGHGWQPQGVAAVANGMALHGGFLCCVGAELAHVDQLRPAIRMAARMGLRVVHALHEDGDGARPTEQLAALRAIPNLLVIRPADAVETAESWALALTSTRTPTVLSLSQQDVPTQRAGAAEGNRVARGAYVLRHARGPRKATLLASGAELALAVNAAQQLEAEGIAVAVVSVPCFALFAQQADDYRARVLGAAPRIGVEAGVRDGWDRWIGADGAFVGHGVGGITQPIDVETIVAAVCSALALESPRRAASA